MVIPLIYTLKYKKTSLIDICLITGSMMLIVIGYWPLTLGFNSTANIIPKFILFVFFPLLILYGTWKIKTRNNGEEFSLEPFGISYKGMEPSFKLGLLFIPLMVFVTFIARVVMTINSVQPNFAFGVVSFVESFTEEFFFRGILFLFLWKKTNQPVAYLTSLSSFILMHPQNYANPFIISTITQGILTLEICRRTKNIAGAWVLHGTNRFFSIVLLPFIL